MKKKRDVIVLNNQVGGYSSDNSSVYVGEE